MQRDIHTDISALADHEASALTVATLDPEQLTHYRQINRLKTAIESIEPPDPVTYEAIADAFWARSDRVSILWNLITL